MLRMSELYPDHDEDEAQVSGEQLVLPLDIRPARLVHWYNVTRERRRNLLAKSTDRYRFVTGEFGLPTSTEIDAEKISTLADPQLRYALRFADAANAAGSINEGPGATSSYSVTVEAISDGTDSQFVRATYSGLVKDGVDTFMENLRRFELEA